MIVMASIAGMVLAVYATNVGQLVHHVPNPNWIERLGR